MRTCEDIDFVYYGPSKKGGITTLRQQKADIIVPVDFVNSLPYNISRVLIASDGDWVCSRPLGAKTKRLVYS